jgi:uncharacterized BrkB/YihY/UPF0761 family membrane protein
MVIWLAASDAFDLYAARFGSYNKTWGTLLAVVVTLIWLWLTSAALLFGAEVTSQAQPLLLKRARDSRDVSRASTRRCAAICCRVLSSTHPSFSSSLVRARG